MIEAVKETIVVAEKVVKTVNDIKKQEMEKLPDEIDELDVLEGALKVGKRATGGGAEIKGKTEARAVRSLSDEIGESEKISCRDEVKALPDEIGEDVRSAETDEAESTKNSVENDPKLERKDKGENSESDELQEMKGGSYRDVKKGSDGETHEVHHMPADSASYLERDDGPAIKMEKEDHRQTASCGSSREAREYRQVQKELIEQGKFREALQMDIDDICEKFGDKYDDAIAEMLEYVDKLEQEGKINE